MLVVIVFVSVFGGKHALLAAFFAAAIGLARAKSTSGVLWHGFMDAAIVVPILIGMPILGKEALHPLRWIASHLPKNRQVSAALVLGGLLGALLDAVTGTVASLALLQAVGITGTAARIIAACSGNLISSWSVLGEPVLLQMWVSGGCNPLHLAIAIVGVIPATVWLCIWAERILGRGQELEPATFPADKAWIAKVFIPIVTLLIGKFTIGQPGLGLLIGMMLMGLGQKFWHETKAEAVSVTTLSLLFVAMHSTGGVFNSISVNDAWWKLTLSGIAENNAFISGILPSMDKHSWPIVSIVAFGVSTAGSFSQYGSLPTMVASKDPDGGPSANLVDFLKYFHVTGGVYAIGVGSLMALAYWLGLKFSTVEQGSGAEANFLICLFLAFKPAHRRFFTFFEIYP